MAGLLLKNVNKVYPSGEQAVFDLSLEIEDKEFIVLVGPSGCGKSTTLRMIAGLEEVSSGEIYIDGKLVNDVPTKDRDLAIVFQSYGLYPHMTVYDTMAFSLQNRNAPKEVIDERVRAAAEILGITECLSRKPKALSGGQKQRVAIGRAIVRDPKMFLFDEPLSNLDAKLRTSMRTEIAKLYARLGTTFIYVTHDQVEAMTMGTRIVVMKDGFVQQVDSPQNLYDYPVNLFVAEYIGTPRMNVFRGATLTGSEKGVYVNFVGGNTLLLPDSLVERIQNLDAYLGTGKTVTIGIRPEDVHHEDEFLQRAESTQVKARVDMVEKFDTETQLYCELDYEGKSSSSTTSSTQLIACVSGGEEVTVKDVMTFAFDCTRIHLFDGETERTLLARDEGYVNLAKNAEADYVPPTPQEMKTRIESANHVGKKKKNK